MTEAGIDAGLTRDLFIALGEPLDNGTAWSVRIQTKPYIRWIWLGTIFMGIGGILAAVDRRYRKVAEKSVKAKARTTAGAGTGKPVTAAASTMANPSPSGGSVS